MGGQSSGDGAVGPPVFRLVSSEDDIGEFGGWRDGEQPQCWAVVTAFRWASGPDALCSPAHGPHPCHPCPAGAHRDEVERSSVSVTMPLNANGGSSGYSDAGGLGSARRGGGEDLDQGPDGYEQQRYRHDPWEPTSSWRARLGEGLRSLAASIFSRGGAEAAGINHRYSRAERARLRQFESIDYLAPSSRVYRRWLSAQPFGRDWDRCASTGRQRWSGGDTPRRLAGGPGRMGAVQQQQQCAALPAPPPLIARYPLPPCAKNPGGSAGGS